MKNIGIVANGDKDKGLEFTNKLIEVAHKLGMNAEIAGDEVYDLIVSLGGDGTFLNAAIKFFGKDIPIAGINLGNLGYLSTGSKDELEKILLNILNDGYKVEERIVLEANIGDKKLYALNDVVLNRANYEKMIHVDVSLDGKYMDSYNGDGVIVCTPTGSTAYSLSADGPIVEPIIDAMLITPICSHSLTKRPLIISSDRKVSIKVMENHSFMLTTDGRESITGLKSVEIRKAEKTVKVVKLKDNFFFDTLREKFMRNL